MTRCNGYMLEPGNHCGSGFSGVDRGKSRSLKKCKCLSHLISNP